MAVPTKKAAKAGEDYVFSPMTQTEVDIMQPRGQPISMTDTGYPDPYVFSPMTENEAALMQPMGQPISMTDTGYAAPTAAAEPSMWNKLGTWAGENKDLLLAGGMALNDYMKQQKAADIQGNLNQAYAKWSGFNPNLMSNIKQVEYPDIATSAFNAFKSGPVLWNSLANMYEARKNNTLDKYIEKQKLQDALNAGLAAGGGK